jgi:integrase
MRKLNRLSTASINRLALPAPNKNGQQRCRLVADGAGLWIQVSSSGAKSWLLRYRFGGKARAVGLGSLQTVSLAEARIKARKYRNLVLDGIDPVVAKRARRAGELLATAKAMTFKQCAAAYIASHRAGWRSPKSLEAWERTLAAYVYPVIGALPVQVVDVTLVLKVLEPIWPTKPESASRIRGRIESVLDYAKTRGYRTGENPARWRGHLQTLLPQKRKVRRVKPHAALPYGEIAAFIIELRAQNSIAAKALEFTILTAARTGETLGARWSEFDLNAAVWTVPGSRMKSNREHRVPLSAAALTLLAGLGTAGTPSASARIFPISARAMRSALGRLRPGVTVHGFRSSFRDWAMECTDFPSEAAELALAHAVGSRTELAYRRGDLLARRRQLAESWATFCAGSDRGQVIELRPAAG